MNGPQIRDAIEKNNRMIQDLTAINFFTLNNTVAELLEENRRLQQQCRHLFVDGYCDFCLKEEE